MMKLPYHMDEVELADAADLKTRSITEEQIHRFEGYVAEIFSAFGLDLNTAATEETPRRFIRALYDATEGYDGDPKLIRVFDTECRGDPDCHLSQIIEGPIQFYSLCEHHAFPFYGTVHIGYIAHENIIGISKLTRLVRVISKRFAVQERIGQQIADALEDMLHPHAVAVYVQAHHLCVEMRGVREPGALTRTTVWRGAYADDPALRAEFLAACGIRD